jgi:multidrug efflux pump subunit AcrB
MKRAIAWFAQNHVAANLVMILTVVGGLVAIPSIKQQTMVDFETESVQVAVTYLGAAPEEVEEGVCIRIEEELQSLDGIDEITSSAAEGACGVTVELTTGYPVDRAITQVKNQVDAITTFPEETEKPVVSYFEPRSTELLIALHGNASERTLKEVGERVRDEIVALDGVTQVDLSSARDYEISIEVPEASLRRHGLTFAQVVEAVRRGSLDRPGGSIRTRGGEVLLRTKAQAYVGEEFGRIVVHTREDGTRLLLRDVATVVDGFEQDERWARFDGEPAVLIQVSRVGDQRVLDLVETVKAALPDIERRLPGGLSLSIWEDGSRALRERLDILLRAAAGGFVLVFAALTLFLRLRLAFWVCLGIPVAILGALWAFPMSGMSINVITLFAFILVLGLLVDDAIVVGENIHRHQERNENPLEASIRGTQEVTIPVVFGVLTTMAAFLPMLLTTGMMSEIFGAIGLVVICCLIFSIVESQLVLPAHLGHPRRRRSRSEAAASRGPWGSFFAVGLERFAQRVYRPLLSSALEWRYATIASGVAALAICLAFVVTGILPFQFFPLIEKDFVSARLTMPLGTPVEVTTAAIEQIDTAARTLAAELDDEFADLDEPVVRHVFKAMGEHTTRAGPGPPGSGLGSVGPHLAEVSLALMRGEGRPISAEEVAHRWRALTPPIADLEELDFTSALFTAGEPIDVELRSADVSDLERASRRLKRTLAEYPGVYDITDSFRGGKDEIVLSILPAAETLGLTVDDLATQVRHAFYGAEAQRIQRGRDDVRVMVRYPDSQRRSIEDLENLRVRTPDGGEVPFYSVARAERGRGFATIRRTDRQRVINVRADLDIRQVSAANVLESLADEHTGVLPMLVRDFPGMSYAFAGEQEEQRETLGALAVNFVFALVLIYALLAVPLGSYSQPLLIMAVIPFGLIGAIIGHVLMGRPLSIFSVFGVVALSGVVVNSSLVLVHYVNTRRAEGLAVDAAVREAGLARFRPIALTSITTFLGLTPILSEGSVSAQFVIPMAISLGFGVVFATLISLFLVPCGYVVIEDLRRGMRGRRGRVTPLRRVTRPVRDRVASGDRR